MRDSTAEAIAILSPPARLHAILLPFASPGEHDNKPSGEVLSTALRLDPVHVRANWSRAHAEMLAVVHAAEVFVTSRALNYAESPHARTFSTLRQYLTDLPLAESWSVHRRNFEPLIVIALPFSIHAAEMEVAATSVLRAESADVLQRLDSVMEAVTTSDYPRDFKNALLEALLSLRDRIVRFEVFGPEGVGVATATLVGTLVTSEPVAKTSSEIVKETADLVSKIADVFLKTYAVVQLLGPSLLLLRGG